LLIASALAGEGVLHAQVIVGVLEQPQCVEADTRVVRPLFTRQEEHWRSLQHGLPLADYPLEWSLISTESVLAVEVQPPVSRPEPEWTFARDFWLRLAADTALPPAPNACNAFSGWCRAPDHAPLLALANASKVELAAATRRASYEHLRRPLAAVSEMDANAVFCTSEEGLPVKPELLEHRVQAAWTLPGGSELMAVLVSSEIALCTNELGGPPQSRWYVVERPGGHPRFIGEALTYLASADMDSDGAHEHLFWFSAYNRDGYLLFNAGFDPPTRFEWGHH
jgi:hypothetical protein